MCHIELVFKELYHFGVIVGLFRQMGAIVKALVVKNSVLHDFGFGKVSPAKQL